MKHTIVLLATFAIMIVANAQEQKPQKFSPEKFEAELQEFITQEAQLNSKEVAAFFPVYREMHKKQRAIFERQRQWAKAKPADERGCEEAIRQRDKNELELKRIQEAYHHKMLEIVPATKLYDILKAEDRFHRQKLRNWGHGDRPPRQKK